MVDVSQDAKNLDLKRANLQFNLFSILSCPQMNPEEKKPQRVPF
jgi:hypothetical protein